MPKKHAELLKLLRRNAPLGGRARARQMTREERIESARKAGLASAAGRLERISPKRRSAIARKAIRARWAARR